MRICHLCSAHNILDDRVFARECTSLAAAGYEVHLTGSASQPVSSCRNGVYLHPLPAMSSRLKRIARRFQVARTAAGLEPDLYHVHEPELLGPTVAVAGSRPVIWDVHESYVDVIMEKTWIPKPFRRGIRLAWDWRERRLVCRCAAVLPVTEPIAQRYRSMGARVEIIANYPDLSGLLNLPDVPRDGKKCLFLGGITRIRGLLETVQAIAVLKRRGLQVRFEMAGPDQECFVEELLDESKRLGIGEQVAYHGNLSSRDAKMLAQSAGIGIVTYLPLPNHVAGWPTKLFQYMAAALPMVYSNFPGYRKVVEMSGAGLAVDPTNIQEIADAIAKLVENPQLAREMGESGKRAVAKHFNWEQEKDKLLALYESLLFPRA